MNFFYENPFNGQGPLRPDLMPYPGTPPIAPGNPGAPAPHRGPIYGGVDGILDKYPTTANQPMNSAGGEGFTPQMAGLLGDMMQGGQQAPQQQQRPPAVGITPGAYRPFDLWNLMGSG